MSYRKVALEQLAQLIKLLGGVEKVAGLVAGRPPANFKYGQATLSQVEVVFNKLGGAEAVWALIRGEKKVTLEDVVALLIARNGRGVHPSEVVTAAVCDANKKFHFDRLPDEVDDVAFLLQWEQRFEQKAGISADEFRARIQAIKQSVATWPQADKPRIANLFNGPHFPTILPLTPAGDHGTIIESRIQPIVKKAYEEAFPGRQFVNYREGELAEQVTIVDERYQRLIADLVKGPIVGVVCHPLQGFSVHAQQQFVELLPNFISLMGPVDAGAATAMYPKFLARDSKTPVQDCSAVQWRDPSCSLGFDAGDDKLGFGGGTDLGDADGGCTGGFFVRG